jgi:hypothetical protein
VAAAHRRALVTGVVSVAPNTYVVGVERGEGLMVVHQLVRRRGREVPMSMRSGGSLRRRPCSRQDRATTTLATSRAAPARRATAWPWRPTFS